MKYTPKVEDRRKEEVAIIGAGPAGIITGVTAKTQNPDKSILLFK